MKIVHGIVYIVVIIMNHTMDNTTDYCVDIDIVLIGMLIIGITMFVLGYMMGKSV